MDTAAPTAEQRYVLLMCNRQDVTIKLILEPRAVEFDMPPGAAIEVRVEGPAGPPLEVRYTADAIIVWGWAGSITTVYQDGVALESYENGYPRPFPYLWPSPPEAPG